MDWLILVLAIAGGMVFAEIISVKVPNRNYRLLAIFLLALLLLLLRRLVVIPSFFQ